MKGLPRGHWAAAGGVPLRELIRRVPRGGGAVEMQEKKVWGPPEPQCEVKLVCGIRFAQPRAVCNSLEKEKRINREGR